MLIRTIPTSFIAVASLATLALLAACEPADDQSTQGAGQDAGETVEPETAQTAAEAGPDPAGPLPPAFADVPDTPQRNSHWTMRDPGCGQDDIPEHHRQLFPDGTALSFVETKDGIIMVDRGGLRGDWTRVKWTAHEGKPLDTDTDLDDCADGASIMAHVLREGAEYLHGTVDLKDGDDIRHAHDVFVVARGVSEKDPRGEIFFVTRDEGAAGDEKSDEFHEGSAHGAH